MVQDNGVILCAVNMWSVILQVLPTGPDANRSLHRHDGALTSYATIPVTIPGHVFIYTYMYIETHTCLKILK